MNSDPAYMQWKQNDPRFNGTEAWPKELFPKAEYRYFRDAGCLVFALAVMLCHYSIETADESLFNPLILNGRLIDCGAFTPSADLELSYLSRLYPLEYLGSVPYSEEKLLCIARSGDPCLITVPGVNAEKHFTAFLGLLPADVLVYDPLHGERKLSEYSLVSEIRSFRFCRSVSQSFQIMN